MCGRKMRLGKDAAPREQLVMDDLADALDRIRQRMTSYNIAPTQAEPVVLRRDAELVVEDMRWGWPNPYGADHINAKGETVHVKRTFSSAFTSQHCLTYVDGWYEWKAGQPHLIHAPDGVWIAGLWRRLPDGQCAYLVITKDSAAATSIAHLHHRMPAILSPEQCLTWLDPQASVGELLELLQPGPHPELQFHAVTRNVGRVSYNEPAAVLPVEVAEQRVLAL